MVIGSLASTGPTWGSFRRVVTVHDLIYRRYPEAHAGIRSLGMRVLVPLAVRRSDRVITVSESSKRDLVELLGTAPELDRIVRALHAAGFRALIAGGAVRDDLLGLAP